MEKISSEKLLNSLNWRYATKQFDPTKKLSVTDWDTLAKVIQLTPSSYGLQPWKAILVQNSDKRKLLREHSWNQPQIEDCSHLIVFTALKNVTKEYVNKYISNIASTRNIPEEQLEAYKNMMTSNIVEGLSNEGMNHWAQKQSYITIGFLLEAASLLNIDACPMEGLDPKKYDQILELEKTDYSTVAVVALGYRSDADMYKDLKKVRQQVSELIEIVL